MKHKVEDYPDYLKDRSLVINNNNEEYKRSMHYRNNQINQNSKLRDIESKLNLILKLLEDKNVNTINQ